MGSVSLNVASSRRGGRRLAFLCSPALLNLLVLLSLLSTNLLALLAFLSPRAHPVPAATANLSSSSSSSAISAQVAAIAREIDATRLVPHRLAAGASDGGGGTTLPSELLLFLSPHALPLGRDACTGLTHMPASMAHTCFRSPSTLALLAFFATYGLRRLAAVVLWVGCFVGRGGGRAAVGGPDEEDVGGVEGEERGGDPDGAGAGEQHGEEVNEPGMCSTK